MTSRLFTLASALSLLLCIVTIATWVPGYWAGEEWGWYDANATTYRAVARGRGRLRYVHATPASQLWPGRPWPPSDVALAFRGSNVGPDKGILPLWRAGYRRYGLSGLWLERAGPGDYAVTASYPLLSLLTAAPPAA